MRSRHWCLESLTLAKVISKSGALLSGRLDLLGIADAREGDFKAAAGWRVWLDLD